MAQCAILPQPASTLVFAESVGKDIMAKADDHYICDSKVIDIPTYEMLANAN